MDNPSSELRTVYSILEADSGFQGKAAHAYLTSYELMKEQSRGCFSIISNGINTTGHGLHIVSMEPESSGQALVICYREFLIKVQRDQVLEDIALNHGR